MPLFLLFSMFNPYVTLIWISGSLFDDPFFKSAHDASSIQHAFTQNASSKHVSSQHASSQHTSSQHASSQNASTQHAYSSDKSVLGSQEKFPANDLLI